MGCIVRAVEYLHVQRVRHKDLKPSNILLSPEGLWLTDFGTATDFSQQTISTIENCERGTPKYFAPEVAAYQPSGRASDIFSLGCILLEMLLIAHGVRFFQHLRDCRSARDKSFQANLKQIQYELDGFDHSNLRTEIRSMLEREPDERPTVTEIRINFELMDTLAKRKGDEALFGDCCRRPYIAADEHEKRLLEMTHAHQKEMEAIRIQAQQKKAELVRRHDLETTELRAKLFALGGILAGVQRSSREVFTCRVCFMSLSSEEDLHQHFEYHHPNEGHLPNDTSSFQNFSRPTS
ncbi:kinase-like protein [Lentithecium fluviatile CBS 122367]|uniref:non-specific serine/threonine protein kinase n=1 Tax=Lentithecium fluviatile CBS 122367 TaxID=1168545 RepID=A0A6G1JMQ0_9PLEO|nr:kinase-like protein [Lentithecium fluviatile CBS 122367]